MFADDFIDSRMVGLFDNTCRASPKILRGLRWLSTSSGLTDTMTSLRCLLQRHRSVHCIVADLLFRRRRLLPYTGRSVPFCLQVKLFATVGKVMRL